MRKLLTLLALVPLVLVEGCASTPSSSTTTDQTVERLDLQVKINGKTYPGWGVVPMANQYSVTVYPAAANNRIQWRTCDREQVVDKNDDSGGWFSDIFGSSSPSNYSFSYAPDPNLDQRHHCPLEIEVLNADKNSDGFAAFEFQDARPEYTLKADLTCNGAMLAGQAGVAMCESAQNLEQRIVFPVPIKIGTPEVGCDVLKDVDGKGQTFQFAMPLGECVYTFAAEAKASNGERVSLRLFTYGHNDVPVRK